MKQLVSPKEIGKRSFHRLSDWKFKNNKGEQSIRVLETGWGWVTNFLHS